MKNKTNVVCINVLPCIISSIIAIILTLLCLDIANGLTITEIMFNPEGADTGREWIELSLEENGGCVNLTEYKLLEDNVNHNIYPLDSDIFCSQAIIFADINKFLNDYPHLNTTIKNENSTILYRSIFSLNNGGELLAIKHNSEFIDYVNYSQIIEYVSVDEGHSLEYAFGVWQESQDVGGSPGIKNFNETLNENVTEVVEAINSSLNSSENNSNTTNATSIENLTNNTTNNTTNVPFLEHLQNYTNNNLSLQTISNELQNTSGYTDNLENVTNISSNTINTTNFNLDPECNVSLYIRLKNESVEEVFIHKNNMPIKFYNKLEFHDVNVKSHNYSIEYWVEDADRNIVKNKIMTNNQDEKSFTPKISETDKILWIRSEIKQINCGITQGSDKRMLLIHNSEYAPPTCLENECKETECKPCSSQTLGISENTALSKTTTCNMSQVKIVNVCNYTEKETKKEDFMYSDTQSVQQGMSDIQTQPGNNPKKGVESLTTGMIIYESPNLKNRFYAIIGLVLVGLALIILSGYRLYTYRSKR